MCGRGYLNPSASPLHQEEMSLRALEAWLAARASEDLPSSTWSLVLFLPNIGNGLQRLWLRSKTKF